MWVIVNIQMWAIFKLTERKVQQVSKMVILSINEREIYERGLQKRYKMVYEPTHLSDSDH